MQLKDGKIIRPFGALSIIEGKVTKDVGEWLLKKGLATKEDFVEVVKTRKPKTEAQKAAAKKKALEVIAKKAKAEEAKKAAAEKAKLAVVKTETKE